MQLDVEDISTTSDEDVRTQITPSKARSNGKANGSELGGSVSRAARMRATTTEDEAEEGSDEEDHDTSDEDAVHSALDHLCI